MKKSVIFLALVLISTSITSNTSVVHAKEVNNTSIEFNSEERLWTEGIYYLNSSYDTIAIETNNWITANVNVSNAPYSEGAITFYIVDSNGKSYSTTDVSPGETKTVRGIPSGGYEVYGKSKSGADIKVVLIIDDWI